jgi:polyhydroxyalkanoate synthesis repressor PhaR
VHESSPTPPATPRLIKRYANRKLYDTASSRYVTLDEIAEMIKLGDDIQIIDNKTKADLTAVTMAQILVEEEKQGRRARPLPALRHLIQRRIAEPVSHIRTSVEESVLRLIRAGEERAEETQRQIKQWIEQNTQALEDLQRRVDDRIKGVVRSEALEGIEARLDQLSARLDRIEAHLNLSAAESASEVEADVEIPGQAS